MIGALQGFLHLGARKIIALGHKTTGVVAAQRPCAWLKINRNAVRSGMADDAITPHIVYFRYTVGGTEYHGSRYLNWTERCPQPGERVRVYFDPANPARYALDV